ASRRSDLMAGDRADGPRDMADPRRDRSAIPYTDADTEALVDEPVATLVIFRCPMGLGDAGPTITAVAGRPPARNRWLPP
ncbi:MAG: hypothetical protein ACRD0U_02640, partial [Acidimicrobiales bacterium]